MKVGDKFKRKYPFKLVDCPTYDSHGMIDGIDEVWAGGCKSAFTPCGDPYLVALDHGFIEFEVLAYVEMPRKYMNRVVYCVTMTDPDGNVQEKNRAHCVTEKKFKSWIDKECAYAWPYEMSDGSELPYTKDFDLF